MKTVLITGATRGIGRATALIFAKNGYNVAINYLNNDELAKSLQDEIKEFGVCSKLYKYDVADYDKCTYMIDDIKKTFGKIDVVINNVGVSMYKLIQDTTIEDFDYIFNNNMKSVWNISKIVSTDMIKRKAGSIVNISSIWGITGASNETLYSASKGAVIAFTKALALELAPSGIRVNCVAPGAVQTDMLNNLDNTELNNLKNQIPLGIIAKPIDIAKTIYFLASENSLFTTGQIFSPNGGILV